MGNQHSLWEKKKIDIINLPGYIDMDIRGKSSCTRQCEKTVQQNNILQSKFD
jgi:dUTPase